MRAEPNEQEGDDTHEGLTARPRSPVKGWHSRGYLPHYDKPGLLQGITFRLHDSVPESVVQGWKLELGWQERLPASDERRTALRRLIADYEDAGHGDCWLRRPDISCIVQQALAFFDTQRYRLLAWCVMPNHVHALIETFPTHAVGSVVQSWKRFSAREANRVLQRIGQPFWFADYHDRFIRHEEHYFKAVAYIHDNPVKAGLVRQASDWQWSSAHPGSAEFHSASEKPVQPGGSSLPGGGD